MLTRLVDIEEAVQGHDLNLSDKHINDTDIELICLYLKEHPDISSLNLRCNNIGDEGAEVLAANKTLTALNVRYNKIGDELKQTIAQRIALNIKTITQYKKECL